MKSDWTPGGFVSPEWFGFILHWTALIIEAARIAVIATGFLIAFLAAIRNVTRREDWDEIYLEVRVNSGAASCSASSSLSRRTSSALLRSDRHWKILRCWG